MSKLINECIRVASRPTGIPAAEHFRRTTEAVPDLEPGQILVKNQWLSIDPAMRGWLADANNYASVDVGSVMRSLCVGTVIESKTDAFSAGDQVMGWLGWQHYAVVAAEAVIQKITTSDLPASLYLGVLG